MLRRGNIATRIGAVIILLLASILIPWWATAILAGVYVIIFRWFLEGVLVGWLLDAIFMPNHIPFVTISLLLFVIVIEIMMYHISK